MKAIEGKSYSKLLTKAQRAFIHLTLLNLIHVDSDTGVCKFPATGDELKYTYKEAVSHEGGYSQEGVDKFWEMVKKEHKIDKDLKKKFCTAEYLPDVFPRTMLSGEPKDPRGQRKKRKMVKYLDIPVEILNDSSASDTE